MDHESWDKYLVAEHELIERAMDVLKGELDKLREGTHDGFRLSRAIDFLLEFGDRLHNKKEEELLFPLLEQRGVPRQGPIGVMLMEHEAERNLLGQMLIELPGLADGPDEARHKMAQTALEYLRVRADHIWKENDVLYAMGRRSFSEEDGRGLLEGFARIDDEHYGAGARARFVQMVEELEAGEAEARRPIHNLTHEQIDAIFEALPVEVTFVDANDQVAYFNRLDRPKIFDRTRSVLGRKVQMCHPAKSVHMVERIVKEFKAGTMDKAEFWIDFNDDKVHIRYFPVRNAEGEYMGVVEVTQEIGDIQKLEGQKRLLD